MQAVPPLPSRRNASPAAESAPDSALTELRALHALAETINRSRSLESVYPEALQALRWICAADRAAVLLSDAQNAMRFAASDGLSDRYRAAVEGHSPWASNEENAQPVLVPEPEREPSIAPCCRYCARKASPRSPSSRSRTRAGCSASSCCISTRRTK